MGKKKDAEAELEKTKTLTKAADESGSSKLNKVHSQTQTALASTPSKD